MPDPVPGPDGQYAHDIFGEDGRKIEAYSPQPLSPDEIEALLAQSYADRPNQAELARMIMEMEGPELPVEPPPAHEAPVEPPGQPPADPSAGTDPWDSYRAFTSGWLGAGEMGEMPDRALADPTPADPRDVRMVQNAGTYQPIGAEFDTTRQPALPGFRVEKDEPTVDQALQMMQNQNNWWAQDNGDDIPPEFGDLFPR